MTWKLKQNLNVKFWHKATVKPNSIWPDQDQVYLQIHQNWAREPGNFKQMDDSLFVTQINRNSSYR